MKVEKKLVVLKSAQNHFWHSCSIIESQIGRALSRSGWDVETIVCDRVISQTQLKRIKELSLHSCLQFYFLSDMLDFQYICESLKFLPNAEYFFPIYGNMTVEQKRWLALERVLTGKKVALLAASPRSLYQLKALTEGESVFLLPFPHQLEAPSRKRNSMASFVYAGRITPQKNVLELQQSFNAALKFNPDMRLHIAGEFHDRGYHLHGLRIQHEKFKELFFKNIELSNGKISYHGFLSQAELIELYAGSDYFCSVSAYHDEDYGVSAAQAALCGLGLILSDWGGHTGIDADAEFVPLKVDDKLIPRVEKRALTRTLVKASKLRPDLNTGSSTERFSYATFTNSFEKILGEDLPPFKGLSRTYKNYCKKCAVSFPFSPDSDEVVPSKELYFKIYKSYLGL